MSEITTLPAEREASYSEWKDWREERFGKPDRQEMCYFDAEIAARVPQTSASTLLEIGFGNGSLLGWAKTRFRSIAGVEQSKLLVQRARTAGFEAHTSIEKFPAQAEFDVVVAMDVLEHLTSDEIETLLKAIALRLKPGGCFIARFPNGDGPFGRINQNGDITHVNALGCMKMTYFAERAHLVLEYIAAPAWAPPQSMKGRLQQRWKRGMRYLVERAVASLYLPHRMTFDMNYVAVLRKQR